MDSMRHLSTSLPPAGRQRPEAPNDLLSSFKAAALSVTNLYKTAAAAQSQARTSGYQDALDDLLAFLDRANLGLDDGEGWRVRQWATERLDGGKPGNTGSAASDDEQETAEEDADTPSVSPEAARKASTPAMVASSSDLAEPPSSTRRSSVSGPPPQLTPERTMQPPAAPSIPHFTFRSQHNYPANHDRQAQPSDIEMDASSVASTPSSTETVRIIPRTSRTSRHHGRRDNKNITLGSGAGSKRKIPYHDFFDIAGFNEEGAEKKDGSGRGGKKGRFI